MRRFGDNLIMDFTYNTNNQAFNLGSLMVTSATGGGITVMYFLCLNQTKDMVGSILDFFTRENPGITASVATVVIDKDYVEWKVLEEKFPLATILLCQFHVIRRFATVIVSKESTILVALRGRGEAILYGMIYAQTTDFFDLKKDEVAELLGDVPPESLEYMEGNWYNCYDMWSNCARDERFNALNTTTNRVECNWGELKLRLGRRTAIDVCVETLIAHLCAILQRELSLLVAAETRRHTRGDCDAFVRPLLRLVSDYTCREIVAEWNVYTNRVDEYSYRAADGIYTVIHGSSGSRPCTVRADTWSCTCRFNVASGMPCRHVMFVGDRVCKLPHLPVASLQKRWRMDDYASMIPKLTAWLDELSSLRLAFLFGEEAQKDLLVAEDYDDDECVSSVVEGQCGLRERAQGCRVRCHRPR